MIEPQPLRPGKCVCLLVYALPGAGKTRLLGSADSALIIRPPTDHTDSISPPAAGIEEVVVEDHNQISELYEWGQQGGFAKYDWVGIDGITLLEEFGLDDVFQAAVDRKAERAEFGPDKGEYGINRSRLTKLLRDMVGLSKAGQFNLMVTAHVMEIYDHVKEQELWTPAFGSAKTTLSLKLCGYMNIVAYLQANEKEDEGRQEVLTVDAEGFVGKDQYNCFPALKSGRHGLVNPTMADVEAAIASKRKPARKRSTAATRAKPAARKRRRKAS